jgi:hypothetical protein
MIYLDIVGFWGYYYVSHVLIELTNTLRRKEMDKNSFNFDNQIFSKYVSLMLLILTLNPWSVFLCNMFGLNETCDLYYKHITIVNDNSIMTLQVVASPMIVILTTLEVSFMLLANIYSRGITHDNRHVTIVIYL